MRRPYETDRSNFSQLKTNSNTSLSSVTKLRLTIPGSYMEYDLIISDY